MKARLVPAMLLLAAAPLLASAEESPPPPKEQTTAVSADAEQLPYGAGYEARRRAAGGQEQAPTPERESAAGRERTRTQADRPAETRPARRDVDRVSTQRESRRQARERWGHHGGRRN